MYIKQTNAYAEYVAHLVEYMKDFVRRAKPLLDFEELRIQVDEMFEGEWEQRSLFGWEAAIAKLNGESPEQATEAAENKKKADGVELNCQACRKTFSNQNVYDFHLKGKRHIKAAAALLAAPGD